MKIVVIPDLHGDSCWSEILDHQSFDIAIFLGDYLDSRNGMDGKKEVNNFNNIIDLKKKHPDQIFLLLGNHEFHYTEAGMKVGEKSPRFQQEYSDIFRLTLFENRELFQMVYKQNDYVFSHAGITESWLNKYSGNLDYSSIDKTVNDTWLRQPEAFALTPEGKTHDWGDDVWQSPIWVRPQSLQADSAKFRNHIIQVVGHTPTAKIELSEQKQQRYYFVDTFRYSKEYLVINNGAVSVATL